MTKYFIYLFGKTNEIFIRGIELNITEQFINSWSFFCKQTHKQRLRKVWIYILCDIVRRNCILHLDIFSYDFKNLRDVVTNLFENL